MKPKNSSDSNVQAESQVMREVFDAYQATALTVLEGGLNIVKAPSAATVYYGAHIKGDKFCILYANKEDAVAKWGSAVKKFMEVVE